MYNDDVDVDISESLDAEQLTVVVQFADSS